MSTLDLPAQPSLAPASASRRRRLWKLPAPAHELLLATSFTPEALRSEVARVIGRRHHARCRVGGDDTDVLFSTLHDLATRNPLSEALQRRLDERHAAALRRLARERDAQALQAVWTEALAADQAPALFWALLTHPLGAALQESMLYDMRAWVFHHARSSLAGAQVQRQSQARTEALHAELAELRARLLQHHQTAAARLQQAHADAARLAGEVARWRGAHEAALLHAAAAHPAAVAVAAAAAATAAATPMRLARPAPACAEPALPGSTRRSRLDAAPPAVPEACPAQARPMARPQTGAAVPIAGRRVLCVGGINGAVQRYRALVEARGGRFLHHDGGIEDSLQRLPAQLAAADLVLCQAACINHEAYRFIKAHCKRSGTACVYLDRPSLSCFESALGSPPDTASRWVPVGAAIGGAPPDASAPPSPA